MQKRNGAKGGEQNTNRIIEEPKQSQTDRERERYQVTNFVFVKKLKSLN